MILRDNLSTISRIKNIDWTQFVMYYIKDTDLLVIRNDNFTKNLNRKFMYLFTFVFYAIALLPGVVSCVHSSLTDCRRPKIKPSLDYTCH